MKYIYRLKFKTKEDWLNIEKQLYKDEVLLFSIYPPIKVNPMLQPEWDVETEERPEKIPIEGYHIDIAGKVYDEDLHKLVNDYIVESSNPTNNWSGGGKVVEKLK